VFVNHLRHGVAQQHNILVKRLNLPLQLDAVNQINGHRYVFATQGIEEGVLQKLAFIAPDIFRVQELLSRFLTLPQRLMGLGSLAITVASRRHCSIFVSIRILRSFKVNPQRRAHQVKFFAKPAF
jgi:hypothetical protein